MFVNMMASELTEGNVHRLSLSNWRRFSCWFCLIKVIRFSQCSNTYLFPNYETYIHINNIIVHILIYLRSMFIVTNDVFLDFVFTKTLLKDGNRLHVIFKCVYALVCC